MNYSLEPVVDFPATFYKGDNLLQAPESKMTDQRLNYGLITVSWPYYGKSRPPEFGQLSTICDTGQEGS